MNPYGCITRTVRVPSDKKYFFFADITGMEDKNLKLWQIVVALSSLAVVIGSMVYWLYGNVGETQLLLSQNGELQEKITACEEQVDTLERENLRLKNAPPQIKEVVVSEPVAAECPACPECPKCAEKGTTKIGEFSVGKPVSIASIVCTKMAIGEWEMPKSCEKEIDRFIEKKVDENGNFFVITPIVDTRQYRGKQPELKQAGLGQFRANRAKQSIRETVGPNIAVFQKNVIQKKEMRGFIIELYQVESYK